MADVAALRRACLQVALDRGFDFAEEAAAEGFAMATAFFLQELGSKAKRVAELRGRSKVCLLDVKEAMNDAKAGGS